MRRPLTLIGDGIGGQGDELDLLNAAGAEGWELVGITSHNMAYLKRVVAEVAATARAGERISPACASKRVRGSCGWHSRG